MLCDDTKIILVFLYLKAMTQNMKSIKITVIIYMHFKLDPHSEGKEYVNEDLSLTLLESFTLILRSYR